MKTDKKDATWISELFERYLVRSNVFSRPKLHIHVQPQVGRCVLCFAAAQAIASLEAEVS